MTTISIITPVWNQSHLTHQFLYQNWMQYPDNEAIEWIIIDNGSEDNTVKMVKQFDRLLGDRLRLIQNDQNEGFSVACNQGAEAAAGQVLLFLNNDVKIFGDYINPLLWQLPAGYPNIKRICGAEYLTHDTGWNTFGGEPIPYMHGWCLAIKRDEFMELGRFDERYSPCDYEDLDLCYNATQQGYELIEVRLPLDHASGQTGLQMGVENRRAITEENRTKFAEKWGLNGWK